MIEYKATKKLGKSLVIFAVLTARTLYTYKYEVAVNNDKLHRSASVFIPGLFILECHLLSFGRAPVRVTPVWFSPREAHLSGRPADTLPPCRVSPIQRRWRTPGCVDGVPAVDSAELAGFSLRSEFFVDIPISRSFFLVRMIVDNLTPTFLLADSAWI